MVGSDRRDSPRHAVTAAVGAGIAAASTYGGLKAEWSLGGSLFVQGTPPWRDRTDGWRHVGPVVRFLAFEGTVLLAGLAVLVLLSLVRPWGRRLPRLLLATLAWSGCALLLTVWVGGMTRVLIGATRSASEPGELTPAGFWVVSSSFLVLGASFGATAWLTRSTVGAPLRMVGRRSPVRQD